MDAQKPNQGHQSPDKGNQQDRDLSRNQIDREHAGDAADRSTADDRPAGSRRQNNEEGIPELDEPNVEGVGEERGTSLEADEDLTR